MEKKYVELQIDRKQVNRCVHYRENVREWSEREKRREREREMVKGSRRKSVRDRKRQTANK